MAQASQALKDLYTSCSFAAPGLAAEAAETAKVARSKRMEEICALIAQTGTQYSEDASKPKTCFILKTVLNAKCYVAIRANN